MTPQWISAISTAVLGLFAAAFGIWQFWAQGFRPRVKGKIDVQRKAVAVEIRNRGRAAGVIGRIVLVEANGLGLKEEAPVNGYADGCFKPTTLPANSGMRLILERPPEYDTLPKDLRLKVDWGTGEAIRPLQQVDTSYASLKSVLPPTSSGS